MSDSLRLHGLSPTRHHCPWDFPGKNTGVTCHFLPQRIFPTQELNLHLPHWRVDSLPLIHQRSKFNDAACKITSIHSHLGEKFQQHSSMCASLSWKMQTSEIASVMSDSLQPYGLCRPSGSFVPGVLQAIILEWPASSSRVSSWPKDRILVSYISCISRWVLYH